MQLASRQGDPSLVGRTTFTGAGVLKASLVLLVHYVLTALGLLL